eukprot:3666293-Pyramimonas_sp.AAC.1
MGSAGAPSSAQAKRGRYLSDDGRIAESISMDFRADQEAEAQRKALGKGMPGNDQPTHPSQ